MTPAQIAEAGARVEALDLITMSASRPRSGIAKSGNLTAKARTVGCDARIACVIARATEVAPIVAVTGGRGTS